MDKQRSKVMPKGKGREWREGKRERRESRAEVEKGTGREGRTGQRERRAVGSST